MTAEAPPYEPYQGSFPLTQMVPGPIPVNMSSDYVYGPSVISGQGSELLVALSAVQQMRMDHYIQIAVVLFDQGQPAGYQIASKTDSFSQEAILAADADGDLHLSWRDGSGGRKLYYASTADAARGAIDSLSGDDVASATLAGLMEAAAGILFFPLALGWLLPGVLLLGIWKLKKEDAGLSHPVTLVMFVVSLILYQLVKLAFLPTILSYVPFSAWIDISPSLGALLRPTVPIFTLVAGVVLAEWLRRRRGDATAFFYFIIACGVDAFLTLAVYGVNFMGVF